MGFICIICTDSLSETPSESTIQQVQQRNRTVSKSPWDVDFVTEATYGRRSEESRDRNGRVTTSVPVESNLITTRCGHIFHSKCLSTWNLTGTQGSQTCPNCRNRFSLAECIQTYPDTWETKSSDYSINTDPVLNDLFEENAILQGKYTELNEENENLKVQFSSMKDEYEKEQSECQRLNAEIKQLQEASLKDQSLKAKLEEALDKSKKHDSGLQLKILEAQNSEELLTKVNQDLRSQLQETFDKLEKEKCSSQLLSIEVDKLQSLLRSNDVIKTCLRKALDKEREMNAALELQIAGDRYTLEIPLPVTDVSRKAAFQELSEQMVKNESLLKELEEIKLQYKDCKNTKEELIIQIKRLKNMLECAEIENELRMFPVNSESIRCLLHTRNKLKEKIRKLTQKSTGDVRTDSTQGVEQFNCDLEISKLKVEDNEECETDAVLGSSSTSNTESIYIPPQLRKLQHVETFLQPKNVEIDAASFKSRNYEQGSDTNWVTEYTGGTNEVVEKKDEGYNNVRSRLIDVNTSKNDEVHEPEYNHVIYVEHLEHDVTEEIFRKSLQIFGKIVSARIFRNDTGKSVVYGEVKFSSLDEAKIACNSLKSIGNRRVFLSLILFTSQEYTPAIYVDNLDYELTENDLRKLFERFGDIVSVKINKDDTEKSLGFGQVTFSTFLEAKKAFERIDGKFIWERRAFVSLSKSTGIRRRQNMGSQKNLIPQPK